MSDAIKVMVNGLPGKMATAIAERASRDKRFKLIPFSLTGPEITDAGKVINRREVILIPAEEKEREKAMEGLVDDYGVFIAIDFTHPSAVNSNAELYCRHNVPFVMGTTGGDRDLLRDVIENSDVSAVVAPNMAKQIVGLQIMMEDIANDFPGLFAGYSLNVRESHQAGKADTSGTAKAMIEYFSKMGIKPFSEKDIYMERDPENQIEEWGIPNKHLNGHAYHTYSLTSPDGTVDIELTHNVRGREIYVDGVFDAVLFLWERCIKEEFSLVKGEMFSMIDILME